jgi:predicted transposase YbfD/YdcC
MHYTVKKTLNLIISSENNYLVKLKRNQKRLLNSVKEIVDTSVAVSCITEKQSKRGREEERITRIYLPTAQIPEDWSGLNRIIHVKRNFQSKTVKHITDSYYISSVISDDAELFSSGIRGHWLIENKLHWVKDVIQKEDSTKNNSGYAPKNMSLIRNIAINIFRNNGHDSVKHATLFFASNVKLLIKVLFRT